MPNEMNITAAIRLLGEYTSGRFDVDNLYGDHNAQRRQHLMQVLTCTKVPRAKAGVNALEKAFMALAKPPANCLALQRDFFREWCRNRLGARQLAA